MCSTPARLDVNCARAVVDRPPAPGGVAVSPCPCGPSPDAAQASAALCHRRDMRRLRLLGLRARTVPFPGNGRCVRADPVPAALDPSGRVPAGPHRAPPRASGSLRRRRRALSTCGRRGVKGEGERSP